MNFKDINDYIQIHFELSNVCNFSCQHKRCPLNLETDNVKTLSTDIIKRTILELKELNYINTITFNSYNEPLMDERILDLIKEARKNLPHNDICITTNGSFLNQKFLDELIDAGVTSMYISVYDNNISRYEQLQSRIRINLHQVRLDNRMKIYDQKEEDLFGSCGNTKQLIISRDAKISLCCYDWKRENDMGDLNTQSLKEIIFDEKFIKSRQSLLEGYRTYSICRKCNGRYLNL